MSKLYWNIRGYNSDRMIYDCEVPVGTFSEKQIKSMLMCLTAKAGLHPDEIVGAYARRRSKVANNLLDVRKDGPHPVYMCGTNPHFVARVVKQED
jgi:hypothetical protein